MSTELLRQYSFLNLANVTYSFQLLFVELFSQYLPTDYLPKENGEIRQGKVGGIISLNQYSQNEINPIKYPPICSLNYVIFFTKSSGSIFVLLMKTVTTHKSKYVSSSVQFFFILFSPAYLFLNDRFHKLNKNN